MDCKAYGVAAVVDGRVDVRTISSDLYNAKRLAIMWIFHLNTTMDTPESYVEFLWQSSVATMLSNEPHRSIELRNVSIQIDHEVVIPEVAPPEGETFIQRNARLTPQSEAAAFSLLPRRLA